MVAAWPCVAASVPAARHDLRAVLADWGVAELCDDAELVLSELLTNAVNAGGHEREIETRYERGTVGVRLEIADGSPADPDMRNAALDAESGRGLALVHAVTGGRWGFADDPVTGGKRVWARVVGSVGAGRTVSHGAAPAPRTRRRPKHLRQDPAAVTWAREKCELTRRALADAGGISPVLMGEIESGWRSATPPNLRRIADVLGCPVTALERQRPRAGRGER
ncbi:ATP-binding protein [Streptomyces sp. CA-111067]|uniref:ATP-binding protein n=1 Tax=Streptomyces sp. CA-111067 TaxID=3240046 RepID=UPI003D988489